MDFVTMMLGLFLVAAPAVLRFQTDVVAGWASVTTGLAIYGVAGWRATTRDNARWEELVVIGAAVAALIVMLMVRPGTVALWSVALVSAAAALIAAAQLAGARRHQRAR